MAEHEPPPAPIDLEAIQARAQRSTERFLRAEWRDRRRQCLFVGGGLLLIGALAGPIASPLLGLSWGVGAALAGGAWLGGALVIGRRWRCPRCERPPVSAPTLAFHHRTLDPPGCARCGLSFRAPPAAELAADTAEAELPAGESASE